MWQRFFLYTYIYKLINIDTYIHVHLCGCIIVNSHCVHHQYGKDYEYEAPVKLLDKLLHELPQSPDEQIVVVSQVFSMPFFLLLLALMLSE